ncbi:lysozyme inhibitor LprI family protein [Paracoccus cavernae]|uniref:Lysozyme inhibitor LprI family protein n=1 Tax=Paracoccus cavernae TaxID=1571207 RepID=A0ABT8D580_9RHOB|nr:lysozyme inhibitor LprI family protein [Paracoccus cavernae]
MRGGFVAAALLVALAAPAGALRAQDAPQYDGALLTACLAGKTGAEARSACIGAASDACMALPAGQTTAGMVQCLGAERDDWDRRLNSTYATLMAEQKAADDELAALGSAVKPERAQWLKEMQRNWIGYRDAACRFDAAQWSGGTGAGPSSTNCMLVLTARQVLFLESYLGRDG